MRELCKIIDNDKIEKLTTTEFKIIIDSLNMSNSMADYQTIDEMIKIADKLKQFTNE